MRAQTISLSGRRKKKLERQIEKYLNALQTHRNDHKIHIDLGDTYAELEDGDKSVKSYSAAIDLLRQAPNVGKTKELIIELYEKIIELSPEKYRPYIDLSEEYIAAGQKEKALRFLLTSAKKAYEEENYELALECYNQAIAKGRTNPHIVERCTELYIKLGRKQEAMQNYLQIGDMYAQDEKNIEALEYYKKACSVEPDNPELLLKVARMYNAMAWTENAASELVKVGEHYEHNHEFTEALRYYNYSVRLDPENERAQEGRVRINQSPSVDELVLTDNETELPSEPSETDVLEQLDQIDETLEYAPEPPTLAQFELTPLDATLTFENSNLEAELLADADESEMETIVLDNATTAEPELTTAPLTEESDDSEAFILNGVQLIDDPMLTSPPEETLIFPYNTDDDAAFDPETMELQPMLNAEIDASDNAAESQPPMNLFMLDDHEEERAEDAELPGSNLFPLTESGNMPDLLDPSALFSYTESPESATPARIEPSMLPMSDGEEPLDDLRSFISEEGDELLIDAEALFTNEQQDSGFLDDISPFDEELLPFSEDANALPPATPDGRSDTDTATPSISLEDWIIDLKEDELVELALEEALREQEHEASANWEELLGLEPSREANDPQVSIPGQLTASDENAVRSAASQFENLGATGDIIDIQPGTPATDHRKSWQESDSGMPQDAAPEQAETLEFVHHETINASEESDDNEESDSIFDTLIVDGESDDARNLYLDDNPFDDAQDLSAYSDSKEENESAHEDEAFDQGQFFLDAEKEDEGPEDDVYNNTGVGMFLDDDEGAEEDNKIGVSLLGDALLPHHAEQSDDILEETLQFSAKSSDNDGDVQEFSEEDESDLDGFIETQIQFDTAESDEEDTDDENADLSVFQDTVEIEVDMSDTPDEVSDQSDMHQDETLHTADRDELLHEDNNLAPEDTVKDDDFFVEEKISADSVDTEPETVDAGPSHDIADTTVSSSPQSPMYDDGDETTDDAPEDTLVEDVVGNAFSQSEEADDIEELLEDSGIHELLAGHEPEEDAETSGISGDIRNLRQRIDDLEQQLGRTEEEKYFLQERFAAQISHHKAHEESLQREIAVVYRDKAELEKQLHVPHEGTGAEVVETAVVETAVPVSQVTAGANVAGFDNDRYDALIEKIEQKKTRIQKQLHKLLKKREEGGRYLSQELDVLTTAKQRLQQNLDYMQQVKARVEEKVNTELRQAQENVAALTKTSESLESQLRAQRQQEQKLRKEFAGLRQEKEQLQADYAGTLSEFQHEKTELEQQVQQVSQAKHTAERALKKKLQSLHRSYQQLKGEYKTVIELKDAQLAQSAQKLSNVTSKYKKLEKILAEIRQERARLNTRLHEEISARESLEEKLVTIEAHVDSFDVQESKLVKQLDHELERHFTQEQHVSDKFQLSLDEFEGLLALQEREIQTLEAI